MADFIFSSLPAESIYLIPPITIKKSDRIPTIETIGNIGRTHSIPENELPLANEIADERKQIIHERDGCPV